MIYPACLQKKDRGRDAIKTMRPLAFGEDHVRVSVEGMEALGRMLEKGEIDEAELESLEAWKEEKKEKNLEGNTVTRKKQKPTKISKEALEFAEGARHKQWERMAGKKGKSEEEEEEKEEEKEDEALLEGGEEEEEIEEEVIESDEEEEEEEGDEMNEEEMNENEDDNEPIDNENENENEMNENESSPMEESDAEESEDSDSMSPEKAEEVRQRRIALAREFMSTHILPPKLFRILQGNRGDSDSSDSDDSEEQTADVANEIVSHPSFLIP